MQSGTGRKSHKQIEELEKNKDYLKKRKRYEDEEGKVIIVKRNEYNKLCADFHSTKGINQILKSDDEKFLENENNIHEGKDSHSEILFKQKFRDNDSHELDVGEITVSDSTKIKKNKKKDKNKPNESFQNLDEDTKKSAFESQENFICVKNKIPENKPINSNISEENNFPWLSEKSSCHRGMLKLHWEIIEFYEFIKPTNEEDILREKSYLIFKNLIYENLKNLTVKKFGSFPTKLHLPDSDVDIVVISNDENQDQMKILRKIAQLLIENNLVDYIKIVDARVPIIKATLKETKINMDISANRKNGYEAKKVIKKVLEDFPQIRPLIYVLKYFLRQRKLNESYTGGISSFLLFNLILAYIFHEMKENDKNKVSLGHLLTGFLQFYSFIFNFEDVGISIRHGGFFYKKSESKFFDPKRNSLLSVENFQELDIDIGKGSFKFRKVLDCFKQARDALYFPSQSPIKSYIGSFITLDNFLIQRAEILKKFNNKLNN